MIELFKSFPAQPVGLHLVLERRARDAERLGGDRVFLDDIEYSNWPRRRSRITMKPSA